MKYSLVLMCFLCALPSLASAVPERLLTSEKRPYNYLNHQSVTGLTIDVLHTMYPQQLPAAVELMPWPRALHTALHTPNVLLFTMGKTALRQQQGFHFIGPVSRREHWLYSAEPGFKPLLSLEQLKSRKLLIVGLRAGWLSEWLQVQGVALETVGDYEQGMQMLAKGRAQLWLSTELEEQVLRNHSPAGQKLKPVLKLGCSYNYLALSPGSSQALIEETRARFALAIRSPQLQQHRQHWQQELGLALGLSPSAGFYLADEGEAKCTMDLASGVRTQ
ncbi:hypothetical protein [Rheinheimera sp.]|uniref:hypothetical protein n=1 Tax=Rheinheimera sp. TaxID=1869214 RepID=UPI00307CD300